MKKYSNSMKVTSSHFYLIRGTSIWIKLMRILLIRVSFSKIPNLWGHMLLNFLMRIILSSNLEGFHQVIKSPKEPKLWQNFTFLIFIVRNHEEWNNWTNSMRLNWIIKEKSKRLSNNLRSKNLKKASSLKKWIS